MPSNLDRAMREASSSRTVTDTDSYAFLVYINQSNANEGMTEAKNCNNEKWPMPKKFGYTVFILIAFVLPMRSQSTDDANILNHKQKVITFKDADKIVVGPVDKKEFVSGQYVAIYDYHFNEAKYYDVYIESGKLVVKQGKEKTSITPFLSGIYYGNASIPYIKGEL